jgi:hypothetical protein
MVRSKSGDGKESVSGAQLQSMEALHRRRTMRTAVKNTRFMGTPFQAMDGI